MRRLLLALVFLVVSVSGAFADVRFYFVPKIGDGLTRQTAFRPKYTEVGSLGAGLDLSNWTALDYGVETVMVLALDVTPEQHAALSAQADVLAIPANLDNVISALALGTIQTKLEALNLPTEWVTTAMTYRQALRSLLKIIQFAQRYNGINGAIRLFETGVTLDSRWNQLTNPQQQRIRTTADSLQLDYSAVTNTMTLRQILRLVADQLPGLTVKGEAF